MTKSNLKLEAIKVEDREYSNHTTSNLQVKRNGFLKFNLNKGEN